MFKYFEDLWKLIKVNFIIWIKFNFDEINIKFHQISFAVWNIDLYDLSLVTIHNQLTKRNV